MHKKTLIILLVIPFIIGLLSFVSVVIMNNSVAADITNILWEYDDNHGFKISDTPYELKAEPVIQEGINIAKGNDLVWSIRKNNNSDPDYARIEQINSKFYLYALEEGQLQVVCSNEKGTVSKSFNAHIFENGLILVNTKIKRSGQNVDPKLYWGQYDIAYNGLKRDEITKKQALIELNPTLVGQEEEISVKETSTNIRHNGQFVFEILSSGPAYVDFVSPSASSHFTFEVVESGVNVYNYNDLLMCTNFSTKGEIVVLQTNLESLSNTYVKTSTGYKDELLNKNTNTHLFGNYNFSNQKTSFDKEIVELPSTYNTEYIDQYNKLKGTNFTKNIKVGIEVKKDVYGNGYTINTHELSFPTNGLKANNYDNHGILAPTSGDYFFGPLPFVTIGDLSNAAIVKAYGQDNASMYINGDNIVINDLKLRNSNDIDNLYNLLFTGTVLEVGGHNNVIKNSILSHGRNVVRAYSSDGLHIDNSILRYGGQFLLALGSNEYAKVEKGKNVNFEFGEDEINSTLAEYLDFEDGKFNSYSNVYLEAGKISDTQTVNVVKDFFENTQYGLDNLKDYVNADGSINYSDTVKVTRSYFALSGIFPIAFESLFNGPYLYNGSPSYLSQFLSAIGVVLPDNISGTSSPVKLQLDYASRFYDWKDISDLNTINSSILIQENITELIKTMGSTQVELSIEDYFPMKRTLINKVNNLGYVYKQDNKQYLNTKVAWYGGGLNLSGIEYISNEGLFDVSDKFDIDIATNSITGSNISSAHELVLVLARYVAAATGYHNFSFMTNGKVTQGIEPIDFEKDPQIEDLYNNLK